ncbi:hypothetical protein, unknown function [Leishmania infantum JPCM5]|uniref:Uncharacterized protein n=2 Tax=Leishmania infantum TaxID=5671 RepID=A4HW69_LEIIN|nr:hypothetical protein, unknown function [Leishmania infantum JPCM5]CAC9470007.1 hypothetical_protein_-_conserved [Leishmania infantum]CAM66691.1 hypothetical protein, unknown function [Leishmania infantum JPCM5]SUZ40363.1 hypothetical_protein_-_conserved [Leishmania infantum]|eukprot:XP_001464310.1 hypothetical protein, unknown function [Leishmania infantum JPCM5]
MRLRIERAARTEQRHIAEKELSARVDELLQALARRILVCAPTWAVQASASSQKLTHHASGAAALSWGGWGDAELADVRSTMTEVQELVDVHVARPRDAAAATHEGGADGMRGSSPAATVLTSGASAVPASSVRFYAAFVRQLIERIFDSVTKIALSSVVFPDRTHGASGAAEDDAVIVQGAAPNDISSLFPAQSALRLPAIVYIGWRCGYSLLTSVGRMLRVADDDRAAGWLDVTSAALRSLLDGARAHGFDPSAAAAPTAAAALHHFVVRTEMQTRSLQCLWWWCSLVFEHGHTHGLLTTPPSAPSAATPLNTPESTRTSHSMTTATAVTAAGACGSAGGTTMHASLADREDYRTLWYIGHAEAASYLSSTVLPTVAHFLHAALARFVFSAASPQQYWPSHAADLTEAVQAVRDVTEHLFPSPAPSTSASPSARSPSSHIQLTAATASFLRHAVHDALLPLAERVLDDPALMQDRIAPTAEAASVTPGTVAPTSAYDGWGSSCEEECEGVEVKDADSCCPSSTQTAVTAAAPAEASQSTLTYALDALERELGDLVRADSAFMTLRRL